ncbi:hypothetical protein [Curtobacterium luteum]|uniref:hypothetical protein n=1 Tax=Curtobacterium luteum TaxID=33881 RepID=UPI0037FC03FE
MSIGLALAVVAGVVTAGPVQSASAAAPTTGRFTPVAPARAWSGTATSKATTVTLGGRNGIPSTATAVVLTATVGSPTAAGYVSVAPAGSASSPAIQNFAKGQPISGTTTVALTSGKAQVKVSAGSATVSLDVAGWYGTSSTGSTYTPLAPTNVLDGTLSTTPTRIPIAGVAGVPENATAVVLQADVSRPATSGRMRITPAGNTAGVVSLMYSKGTTIANTVTVGLSGGAVQAVVSTGTARSLADVVGYYAPDDSGSVFVPSYPVRAATVATTTTAKNITVAGTAGVPRNATAAVINAKVGKGSVGGSLRVVGAGLASSVPTQVYAKGQTIGNALIAPLSSGGRISAKVSAGTATAYVDVVGYFLDGNSGSGTGVDVSHPQCAAKDSPNFVSSLAPADRSFAIVGVNGVLGDRANPCFAQELAWAQGASGGTAQDAAQLYVIAANPGAPGSNSDPEEPGSSAWPTSNEYPAGTVVNNPYGKCVPYSKTKPVSTSPCSFMYGYFRAYDDVEKFGPSSSASYRWWLDVENEFSWQPNQALNRAALEGMIAALQNRGVTKVGIYSTPSNFPEIMGTVPSGSPARGLPSWLAIGTGRLDQAQAACSSAGFAGGNVAMTQYVTAFGSGEIDRDWSCS